MRTFIDLRIRRHVLVAPGPGQRRGGLHRTRAQPLTEDVVLPTPALVPPVLGRGEAAVGDPYDPGQGPVPQVLAGLADQRRVSLVLPGQRHTAPGSHRRPPARPGNARAARGCWVPKSGIPSRRRRRRSRPGASGPGRSARRVLHLASRPRPAPGRARRRDGIPGAVPAPARPRGTLEVPRLPKLQHVFSAATRRRPDSAGHHRTTQDRPLTCWCWSGGRSRWCGE